MSGSESEDGSDFVVVVAVVVAAITLNVVLLVGGFLTIHLFHKKNLIRYEIKYLISVILQHNSYSVKGPRSQCFRILT